MESIWVVPEPSSTKESIPTEKEPESEEPTTTEAPGSEEPSNPPKPKEQPLDIQEYDHFVVVSRITQGEEYVFSYRYKPNILLTSAFVFNSLKI